MKAAIIFGVLAMVAAEKLPAASPAAPAPIPVLILRSSQVNPDPFGAHSSDFEADNGIAFRFSGKEGLAGGSNQEGEYSYILEDGTIAKVTFTADENGFVAISDLLPKAPLNPHPMPPHALEQIEKARLEHEAAAAAAAAEAAAAPQA